MENFLIGSKKARERYRRGRIESGKFQECQPRRLNINRTRTVHNAKAYEKSERGRNYRSFVFRTKGTTTILLIKRRAGTIWAKKSRPGERCDRAGRRGGRLVSVYVIVLILQEAVSRSQFFIVPRLHRHADC